MYVCTQCECLVSKEGRRGRQVPWTWLTDDCVSPFGFWKFNLDPLQEEQEPEALLKQDGCQPHNDLQDLHSSHVCPFSPLGSLHE